MILPTAFVSLFPQIHAVVNVVVPSTGTPTELVAVRYT